MKKITKSNQILIALIVFFSALCISLSAQVQNDFTARFNETVNGDVTMIANNMLSRHATNNYNDEDGNHDFSNSV